MLLKCCNTVYFKDKGPGKEQQTIRLQKQTTNIWFIIEAITSFILIY